MTAIDDTSQINELPTLMEAGRWTHQPASVSSAGDGLIVTAMSGSDAWRHTSYGFVHDSEHALVAPMGRQGALEVSFLLNYAHQFDQAGVFLRVSRECWIKAGVEIADGAPQVGAVVTHGTSDWSASPVPSWRGQLVTVRASREGDAVTIRARAGEEPFQLVRVAHLDPTHEVEAGLFCASPSHEGLSVTFMSYRRGPVDESLH